MNGNWIPPGPPLQPLSWHAGRAWYGKISGFGGFLRATRAAANIFLDHIDSSSIPDPIRGQCPQLPIPRAMPSFFCALDLIHNLLKDLPNLLSFCDFKRGANFETELSSELRKIETHDLSSSANHYLRSSIDGYVIIPIPGSTTHKKGTSAYFRGRDRASTASGRARTQCSHPALLCFVR